jgi:hypothetical protein
MAAHPSSGPSSCPGSELSTLSDLAVIDDPAELCRAAGGWRQSVAQLEHPPLWEVDRSSAALRVTAAWPGQCESSRSQCRSGGRLRYCVLKIAHGMVMEDGLVVNASHRFRLLQS